MTGWRDEEPLALRWHIAKSWSPNRLSGGLRRSRTMPTTHTDCCLPRISRSPRHLTKIRSSRFNLVNFVPLRTRSVAGWGWRKPHRHLIQQQDSLQSNHVVCARISDACPTDGTIVNRSTGCGAESCPAAPQWTKAPVQLRFFDASIL